MKKSTLNLSGVIYKLLAKPILFKQSPDDVHNRLLKVGTKLQKSSFIGATIRTIWSYDNKQYLSQTIHDIKFNNPIGLSAGFDKNFELIPLIKNVGFGFMEGGSLTNLPCDGNKRPWFYRLPKTKSLVVYAGLANEGVDKILIRLKHYHKKLFKDFPLNISVAKTNLPEAVEDSDAIDDYISSLIKIKKASVGNLLTINISCPNTYGGEPFTTPAKLKALLNKIDELKLSQPVFIKMPSDLDWPQFNKLLQEIIKHRIAGVTISNLAKDRSKLKLKDELPASVKGNLSGKPTWEISNHLIKETFLNYGDKLTIIGVGGVFSPEDAYTKIKLGASLVELITGMIFEGPQLIGQINLGIVKLLKKDGYRHISEAIGVDAKPYFILNEL
jgi:dihydroorotate dehydrogenase